MGPVSEQTWVEMWTTRPSLRGWQHVAALVPAAAGAATYALTARTRRERIAATAWGVGVTGMLAASAAYHRLPRTEEEWRVLRRIDHAAIWGAVAGTYTPISLAVLPGGAGVALASGMWASGTAAAVAKSALFDRIHPAFNASYVVVSWVGLAILPRTWQRLGPVPTLALIGGGVAFTSGAVAYGAKRPDLVPGVYGYHELFHTATLVGVGLHTVAVVAALRAIRGAARPS